MNIFKKIKLAFWFIFNKDAYLKNTKEMSEKLMIYTRFVMVNGVQHLAILASTGELFQYCSIKEGMLESAIQTFTQDIKYFYNELDTPYEIVPIINQPVPQGYVDAYEIWEKNYDPEAPVMYLCDLFTMDLDGITA